jgi:2-polyprenyl-3-methyl-5-hydroxy-6-metoxy-1,4-benzoquinol methylase
VSDRTAQFFDSYARDFAALYGNENRFPQSLVNRYLRRSMVLRYEKSLEGCQPIEGRTVLDVGCGPGHYSVELARRGAARVVGIDFAPGMVALATERAKAAGVAERCTFQVGDFGAFPASETFDYAIVMGFMDYVADPEAVVRKVLGHARSRAFFSFPAAGGILAWQRQLRYRSRCDLFLYEEARLDALLAAVPAREKRVLRIARDYFVTLAP